MNFIDDDIPRKVKPFLSKVGSISRCEFAGLQGRLSFLILVEPYLPFVRVARDPPGTTVVQVGRYGFASQGTGDIKSVPAFGPCPVPRLSSRIGHLEVGELHCLSNAAKLQFQCARRRPWETTA
jgi:hypothetical protein